uniref:Cytoplasmic dynein 2 heavy chain 1 n=2 Tax=Timema TaxID=61471 RepID=A0A7R9PME0_TIMGE|nr:unnamed protein product [Timema genevievae]
MHVNYNPRLVGLVREVRQLAVLGYKIPIKIQEAADLAKRFMRQAKALEQVANFHNTIGDRMIPSQRPMMLEAALEMAQLVKQQTGVTWGDTAAVDSYIARLQSVVERLSRENNKLASYHVQISDKVIALMNTDLLRHQQQWKDGLKDIRGVVGLVESQKFSNMKSWRAHWDRQLYKALEHQYQVGLAALDQHLPEIKIELVYRQQKLQFRPPMEEIRMKYYGQLKRFLSIPNNFRGVSDCQDSHISPTIIDRNGGRFSHVFSRAEHLFVRLETVKERWRQWVALGSLDLDQLAEQHLHTAEDWDRNFRASKTCSQEIAKLPSTEEKVECFSVSFLPVRAEVELHNRRYWDTLVSSLQISIVRDVGAIDKFISESTQALSRQPHSVEEIGQANVRHCEIMALTPQMLQVYEEAERKNKTLASWTKERVEQLSHVTSLWDNFQTMVDNYQYLISKQVESIKNSLSTQVDNLRAEVEKFQLRWEQLKPRETSLQDGSEDTLLQSLATLRDKRQEWQQLLEQRETLSSVPIVRFIGSDTNIYTAKTQGRGMTGNQGGKPSGIPKEQWLAHFYKPREGSLLFGNLLKENIFTAQVQPTRGSRYTVVQPTSKDCLHFVMEPPELTLFEEIENDLKRHEDMWSLFDEFNKGLQSMSQEEWIIFRSKTYKFEEFLSEWQERLKNSSETTLLTVRLLQDLDRYKEMLPWLKFVHGDMFCDKHWMEMFALIGLPSKPVESLTFGDFLATKDNIIARANDLQELNGRAVSEIAIRQALRELDIWEVEAKFSLTEHKDSRGESVMLIKDFKDILNKVGDNQCLLQSIKNSANYNSFIDRASIWETRLADLDQHLHNLNLIQRKWVYLEPIFGAGTMSQDQARFQRVDHDFRYIMADVSRDSKVVSLCRISNLHQILSTLLDQLSRCQKSLNDFLEEKRSAFPRFYFLGDEDLLEILGQSTKPRVIQAHLKKLFVGIHSVTFDPSEQHITAIRSLEGETVPLKQHVELTAKVEVSSHYLSWPTPEPCYKLVDQSINPLTPRPCYKLVDQSPVSYLHLTWFPLGLHPTSTRLLRFRGTPLRHKYQTCPQREGKREGENGVEEGRQAALRRDSGDSGNCLKLGEPSRWWNQKLHWSSYIPRWFLGGASITNGQLGGISI